MSLDLAVAVCLAFGVAIELACGIGVLVMDNALDRLHFVGPATILGPLAFAAAAWLQRGADQASIKATLVLLLVVLAGPVLSHVTARAIVNRARRP
ncbi:MAG TPA: monovalent cation/H(+) antiporter subunit G [Chloroflexota bacterium]|jgi:multicomponent Na+:H+ antiporter subunit G|nr:monovalent cation/H(+) antiporter subunit G [Chloroflexota bacterium]